jgi:hypothetical protein
MAQLNRPIAWVGGFRKTGATLIGVHDPMKTLKPYRATRESRQLDQKRACGVLAVYNNGRHLFIDTTYYRFFFDGYKHPAWSHPGLCLVPRKTFGTVKGVTLGNTKSSNDTFFFLQHQGFTGEEGRKTAHVWFHTGSQFARPWHITVSPHTMTHVILDHEDWHLETLWTRPVVMRPSLLDRTRHLTCHSST